MKKFVKKVSPDPRDSNGKNLRPPGELINENERGDVYFLSPSTTQDLPPILSVNGATGKKESRADREVEGTYEKQYAKEGLVTNPASIWPPSFFTPQPGVIRGMFSGPLSIVDNPQLIVAIIAIVAISSNTSDKKEKSYSYHYNNLPLQIIDNQELEDVLLGE
jgi:hypothetical protein